MPDKAAEYLVNLTQEKWSSIILQIGKACKEKSDLENLVSKLLHDVYAFDH